MNVSTPGGNLSKSRWIALARWINPAIRELPAEIQAIHSVELMTAMMLLPFTLAGITWLIVITRPQQIAAIPLPLLVLLLLSTAIGHFLFKIFILLEHHQHLTVFASLSELILWGSALTFGPAAVWLIVLDGLIAAVVMTRDRARREQDIFSPVFSLFVQQSVDVLPTLVALQVYQSLGGKYPFGETSLAAWGPVLAASLVHAVISRLILLPSLWQINRMVGNTREASESRLFVSVLFGFGLTASLFAWLIPLSWSLGGWSMFLFVLVAIFLVNLLAHSFSQMLERSRQNARELGQLEELSEAIIRETDLLPRLPDLLNRYVPGMFPRDRIEIRLKDPAIHLVYPADWKELPLDIWEVCGETAPYKLVKDFRPGGTSFVRGDALLVPIRANKAPGEGAGGCVGGAALLRSRHESPVLDSLSAMQALASQIGSALDRARFFEEALSLERAEQELRLAGEIQLSFLPDHVPQIPGWSLSAALEPARQTSGDFFDLVERLDGRLALMVADVADKGTGAALFMALTRTLLRTYAVTADHPTQILDQANQRIFADTRSDQFVTLFFALLDPSSGVLCYSNAGHNPALLVHPDGAWEELTRTGMPLGVFDDLTWDQREARLQPGDMLLIYTDGVTDAQNGAGDFFDFDRLLKAVLELRHEQARPIVEGLLRVLQEFSGDAPRMDDQTLLVVKRMEQIGGNYGETDE